MGNGFCAQDELGAVVDFEENVAELSTEERLGQNNGYNRDVDEAQDRKSEPSKAFPDPHVVIAKAEAEAEAAAKAEACATFCVFTVKLVRDTPCEPLGIGLRRSTVIDQVVIRCLRGKFLERWQAANVDLRIMRGDEIIAVNGVSGRPLVLVEQMSHGIEVEMILRRQLRITAELTKTNNPLGLGIGFDDESMVVSAIIGGMMKKYNCTCLPNVEIFEGDRLLEINGQTATRDTISDELSKAEDGDTITLIFARTAPGFAII